MKKISIKKSIKYGINTTLDNFFLLAGILLVTITLGGLSSYLMNINTFFSILGFILQTVLSLIALRMILNIYGKEKKVFNNLGVAFDNFWNYLFSTILYSILVIIGLILFIIPGLIFMVKYQFAPILIIDKKMTVSEAFKTSNKMASGVQWKLFGFMILSIFLQFVGFICFGVGLFITIPLVWMAMIYIYKELLKQIDGNSKEVKK